MQFFKNSILLVKVFFSRVIITAVLKLMSNGVRFDDSFSDSRSEIESMLERCNASATLTAISEYEKVYNKESVIDRAIMRQFDKTRNLINKYSD